MPGIFARILEIKSFREARAALAVTRQRLAFEQAEHEEQASRRRLEDHRDDSRRREQALYDDLCRQVVRLAQIQDLQLAVEDMRVQARAHEKRVEQAQAERHRQADELLGRREVHAQALKLKSRFVELARTAAEEAAWEADRREELELEEVAEIRSGRVLRERQQEESPP